MKRIVCLLASLALSAVPIPCAQAQNPAPGITVTFKDGKATVSSGVRRSGNSLLVKVPIGTSVGEVGYPIDSIANVAFPEPPEIKAAQDLLAQNKAAEALAKIEPVATYYAPFQGVPGNWWVPAASVQLQALVALGRDSQVESLIADLSKASADPAAVRMARVQQAASWVRKGEYARALPVLDEAIAQSTDPAVLAQAWLRKGDILLDQKEWEPAVLAYLHVPVYYSSQKLLVPQALLGSARAIAGLGDKPAATERYEEIMKTFPQSAEAVTAKAELEKLKKS